MGGGWGGGSSTPRVGGRGAYRAWGAARPRGCRVAGGRRAARGRGAAAGRRAGWRRSSGPAAGPGGCHRGPRVGAAAGGGGGLGAQACERVRAHTRVSHTHAGGRHAGVHTDGTRGCGSCVRVCTRVLDGARAPAHACAQAWDTCTRVCMGQACTRAHTQHGPGKRVCTHVHGAVTHTSTAPAQACAHACAYRVHTSSTRVHACRERGHGCTHMCMEQVHTCARIGHECAQTHGW